MSDAIDETDNVTVLREAAEEVDANCPITPYGLICAANEIEQLRASLSEIHTFSEVVEWGVDHSKIRVQYVPKNTDADEIDHLKRLLRRHVDLQVGSLSKEEEDALRKDTFAALADWRDADE